jgi:hypothetical protein
MNLLVLSHDPVDADDVRAALPGEELEGARVLVVAPAEPQSSLAFWMSDVDEAIAEASDSAAETVASLQQAGAQARGDAGEADPLTALADALATYDADRVVVFGEDEALASAARERFGERVVRAG